MPWLQLPLARELALCLDLRKLSVRFFTFGACGMCSSLEMRETPFHNEFVIQLLAELVA
jgi:hypothetical protein